jgi:Pyruvate/2-oxoacid:ferredoxin oxidoreductase delta subunit
MEKRKIDSVRQLPVMPLTIEDMTWNKTGTWRLLTPVATDKTAPCMGACPIGQPIPQFIQAVLERDWETALARLLEVNPLPGITGRLCYHPCQTSCVRKDLDRALSIKDLERLAADNGGLPGLTRRAASGRKAAVCGAGPAGLTAAYLLALEGHQITVLEPSAEPGGFLRDVSADKLPAEVLEREIGRLTAVSGVEIETNATEIESGNYDLVLVDRTAYPAGSDQAQAVETLAGTAAKRLDIEPKENGAGFKAVQVAEAVALGRWASDEAARLLGAVTGEAGPSAVVLKGDLKPHRLPDQKTMDLLEKAKGSVDEDAVTEAARCLSCGTCNLCQSCVLACPDACCRLDEEEGEITIDLYHCKGCGICSYECPRGVLIMENLP